MQSMWAGALVFGLMEIPVRLGPATRPRELAFRQVHTDDGGRITFRRACSACGADVPYADVAKAHQRPDGELVALTDEDLAALPLEAAHRIEISSFVAPGAIDPLLVSRSYFLTPGDAAAGDAAADAGAAAAAAPKAGAGPSSGRDRAFRLFHTALARSGQVAVATITVRQREARAAIWARRPALGLQTLLTADELTDPGDPGQPIDPAELDADPDPAGTADLIAAMT